MKAACRPRLRIPQHLQRPAMGRTSNLSSFKCWAFSTLYGQPFGLLLLRCMLRRRTPNGFHTAQPAPPPGICRLWCDRLCDKLALPKGRGFVLSPLYFISTGNVYIFFCSILITPIYRFSVTDSRLMPAKGEPTGLQASGAAGSAMVKTFSWRSPL